MSNSGQTPPFSQWLRPFGLDRMLGWSSTSNNNGIGTSNENSRLATTFGAAFMLIALTTGSYLYVRRNWAFFSGIKNKFIQLSLSNKASSTKPKLF